MLLFIICLFAPFVLLLSCLVASFPFVGCLDVIACIRSYLVVGMLISLLSLSLSCLAFILECDNMFCLLLCCLPCLLYAIMYVSYMIGCIPCIHTCLFCLCMCLCLLVHVFKHFSTYWFLVGSYLFLHTGSRVPFLEPCLLARRSSVILSNESTDIESKPIFVS